MALDTETYDPYLKKLGISARRGGYIVGVSFAIEDGPCHYLPIRHQGGDNLPEDAVLGYLQEQARNFRGEIVGANLPYDLDYLLNDGIKFTPKYFRDIQIADPLIYELHQSYSMQSISERYGLPGKDETILVQAARNNNVDPKGGLWKLPARYVGEYAEQDARLPLAILRKQERRIDDEDLWDIYNLESEVLPVLLEFSRRGVRINVEKLQEIEEWTIQQEAEALDKVYKATGIKIKLGDVWKAETVAPALRHVGIKLELTSQGQPSIDKDLLKHANHPVAEAIGWARKTNKLRTTFAASIRQYMVGDRIHTTFNQIAAETEAGEQKGARYGRCSSTDPNLQQQPAREEFAAMWRSIYIPEPGQLWACCDYSLQEPRWTTHFAAKLRLKGAEEAMRKFHEDPKFDPHQFMSDVTGWERKVAKNIYLGLCYGEGGAKLCDQLELPTRWALSTGKERRVIYFEEKKDAQREALNHEIKFLWRAAGEKGQAILDKFNEYTPYVRLLAGKAQASAQKRGYVITAGGRRLRFPLNEDGTFDWTHKALNRIIQGTSADQVKRAMVQLHKELPEFFMQLQVHDEIDASVPNPEVAKKAAAIMECCMPALVPFRVDIELGPSWGEIEK